MVYFKLIRQINAHDCGRATIAMILHYYGSKVDITELNDNKMQFDQNLSIFDIVKILTEYQFNTKAIRIQKEELASSFTLPAIALIKNEQLENHYIVIYKIKKGLIYIADPAKGKYKLSIEKFNDIFTGNLILMVPDSQYKKVNKKMNSLWQITKEFIFPHKSLVISIIISSTLITLLGIVCGSFSKIIMDEIIPYAQTNKLVIIIIFFLLIGFIKIILTAGRQYILLFLSIKIDIPLSLGYFDHILNLPFSFFGTRHVGDILTRYQDSATVKNVVTSLVLSLFLDIFLAISSSIILFNICKELYLILIIEMIFEIILIYAFKKPYKNLNIDLMKLNSNVNSYLIESFQNIETVKVFNNEKKTLRKLENKIAGLVQRSFSGSLVQIFQEVLTATIDNIFPLLLYGAGACFIIDGKMSIGDLLFFQTLSLYFMQPIENLASLQLTLQEANIALKRLNELLNIDKENREQGLTTPDLNGDIQIDHLKFSYNRNQLIFNDLNLSINKGEIIGIIGESGSGKSTLVKLLLGYYDSFVGNIKINGSDIKDIDKYYLRTRIRYVSQNASLFNETLYYNLTYGSEDVSIDVVNNICELLGLSSFIQNLPKKYNTMIEENAVNISVGEKQRICIARALIKGGDIFIFDEVTSNLDGQNEKLVMNILEKLNDKTIIIITHKNQLLNVCDEIYEVENHNIFKVKDKQKVKKEMRNMDLEEITYA